MRRANPISERSGRGQPLAVVNRDSATERNAADDYLVSFRSDDVRRALASIVGCGHGRLDLAPVDMRSLIHRAVLAAGEDE